jgi:phage-related protein
MPSQYYFPPYNASVTFSKWDVVQGDGVRATDLTYYYSLRDGNVGVTPTGRFNIPVTGWSRTDDTATLSFTQGSNPTFYPGSIIYVTGLFNSSLNYTGMITDAGQGFVSYTSPGWPEDITAATIGAISGRLNPSWTTGFAFIPAYQTKSDVNNNTITAQLGDGYSQRSPNGINSYNQNYNFVYTSRRNKEVRAATNFIQNMAGAYAFEVLFPVSSLATNPNAKYVAPTISYTSDSFGLVSYSVTLNRVFDL